MRHAHQYCETMIGLMGMMVLFGCGVNSNDVPADGSRAPQTTNPAVSADDGLQSIKQKAAQLIQNRQADSAEFRTLIQGVTSQFAEVPIITEGNSPQWTHVKMNRDGSGFDAVRFRAPLDEPADLRWGFVSPLGAVSGWYIAPASGTMQGFTAYRAERNLRIPGSDVPRQNTAIFQLLDGGLIQPGQQYLLWFAFSTQEPVSAALSIRLQAAGTFAGDESSRAIADALYVPKPFEHQNSYDYAETFSEGLAEVHYSGKIGFIDLQGRLVIPNLYDASIGFQGGVALVRKGEWRGILSRDGSVKSLPNEIFHGIAAFHDFSNGFIPVTINGKYGFINRIGETVVPAIYDGAHGFTENLAPIQKGEKWGYVDRDGKVVIPPQFDGAYGFDEEIGRVDIGLERAYINTDGSFAFAERFQSGLEFSGGLASVKKDRKWGYINPEGAWVVEPRFNLAQTFSQGRAAVNIRGEWGLIDTTGEFVVEPKFDGIGSFSEGLASVMVDDRVGYIDRDGEIAIAPQFITGSSFHDGLAAVCTQEKPYREFRFIEKSGRFAWEPE